MPYRMDGFYQGNDFYMLLRLDVQGMLQPIPSCQGLCSCKWAAPHCAQMTRALVGQRIQLTGRASLVSLPIRTLILSAQRLTLWPHIASLEAHLQIHSETEWVGLGASYHHWEAAYESCDPWAFWTSKVPWATWVLCAPPPKEGEFR